MKLDLSRSKAYAGGVGGAGTFLAGQALLDNLTVIISWLLSLVAVPPPQVAQAIAYVVVGIGSYFVGYLITFYAPPNETADAGADAAYLAAKKHFDELQYEVEKKLKGE